MFHLCERSRGPTQGFPSERELSSHAVDGGALLHAVLGDARDGGAVFGDDRSVIPLQAGVTGILHRSPQMTSGPIQAHHTDWSMTPAACTP